MKSKKEYIRAKEAFQDVFISFDRDLNIYSKKIFKMEPSIKEASIKNKMMEGIIQDIQQKIGFLEKKYIKLNAPNVNIELSTELKNELEKIRTSQSFLFKKIEVIEKKTEQKIRIPNIKINAAIPLKSENILSPLTETEMRVLELLNVEGIKTATQIKEKINLSREHTARLMKKLYEKGYVERNTNRIPFRYQIKKELNKILKKINNL